MFRITLTANGKREIRVCFLEKEKHIDESSANNLPILAYDANAKLLNFPEKLKNSKLKMLDKHDHVLVHFCRLLSLLPKY